MTISNRRFGVELELISIWERGEIGHQIEALLGKPAVWDGHRDRDSYKYKYWEVKSDCTVYIEHRYTTNLEITSPILSGEEGIMELALVVNELESIQSRFNGGDWMPAIKANTSCGLHVHHDVTDLDENSIKRLYEWAMSTKLEKILEQLVAPHRINGDYSKRLGRGWHDDSNNRYKSINFGSYWGKGTLEFRLHDGTIDPNRIIPWVILTQNAIEVLMEVKHTKNFHIEDVTDILTDWDDYSEIVANYYNERRLYDRKRVEETA